VTSAPPNPFLSAGRIGLIGDLHGDVFHLLEAARTFKAMGVKLIVQTGDLGFLWPGEDWPRTLNKVSRRLAAHDMSLAFVDGNHEFFPALHGFPVDDDGIRRLRPNLVHLPRGYRTPLSSGRVLGALGGANSIDRWVRGSDVWWAEESITHLDLERLGTEPVDVLVGHDAPLHVPSLDQALAWDRSGHRPSAHEYAIEGRRMFHQGFIAVRPRISVSGHFHHPIDEVVTYIGDDNETFDCRVVILDQGGNSTNLAQAILDVDTLDLQLLTRGGATARFCPETGAIERVGDDADR
jgi:hypothetical protein